MIFLLGFPFVLDKELSSAEVKLTGPHNESKNGKVLIWILLTAISVLVWFLTIAFDHFASPFNTIKKN